ncbi:dihydropteroate synthase [Candidatus Peregrinibacteria bacterium]|nr:dihydropteroate synthase [Candidatus Peregrinibacteria bacterium]
MKKITPNGPPLVMGILNLTPDSFSDGGEYDSLDSAIKRFDEMVEQGADIVDLGGESTGPGSVDVTEEEELKRVIPVLKQVRKRSDVRISVDTYKAKVARQALEHGADIINDVLAFRGDGDIAGMLSNYDNQIIIMYSKDATGRTTGEDREYTDVIRHIKEFFTERIAFAEKKGISRDRLILDPGQGAFVSTVPKYSLQILKNLRAFKSFGLPLMVGSSRKSFIGETLGLPLHERKEGSCACAAVAVGHGADIIRVHAVKEARRVADMVYAVRTC